MSQDFGGSKYSKNMKGLSEISTAKISKAWVGSGLQFCWNHLAAFNNINDELDEYTNENKRKHNLNWPNIPDHPYRILIIWGLGTGKTNALLNFIENHPDIDKIYLYAKDPYVDKYQYLINKRESVVLKHFNDPKAFIEYSDDMYDVYKNIDNYNSNKENKILIVFD